MKRTSFLSFSSALIALGGLLIASPAAGMEDSTAQYFPLSVGNRWVYESTEYPDDRVTDESWEVLRKVPIYSQIAITGWSNLAE